MQIILYNVRTRADVFRLGYKFLFYQCYLTMAVNEACSIHAT